MQIIKDRGLKIGYVCAELGMARATFRGRVNGETEFTVSEITCLCRVLSLTAEERNDIFFANEGECNSRLSAECESLTTA